MNTHNIELPPLPEAVIVSYQTDSTMRRMELRTYSDEDMRDYARAAIESDRQRRGEPEAWRYLTPTGWHATTDAAQALRIAEHHTVEPLYAAPQPAEPVRVPSEDERVAQGLPPYKPRHLTEQEWNRLTESGRRAWSGPVKVPSVFPNKKSFTVEPHGNGYAIYQGRDKSHHGLNLASLTECTPEFAKYIESALNEFSEPTNKHSLSVAEPEKEPPCDT